MRNQCLPRMSASGGGGAGQEEDKKPTDQGAHINLKVKGQVCFLICLSGFGF